MRYLVFVTTEILKPRLHRSTAELLKPRLHRMRCAMTRAQRVSNCQNDHVWTFDHYILILAIILILLDAR